MTEDVERRLERALAHSGERHGPGLFGLVTESGAVVFEGTVGVADLRAPRPIEASDQFRIGSITKTYLATLVLQLVAEGALTLSDPVARWLPGLIPDGDRVTVEMLLRMRSGLPDYVPVLFGDPARVTDPPDLSALERYWSPEQLVTAALGGVERLPPGTRFRYSNTDYVVLGLLVEHATGQRVEAQLWQRIVRPLALRHTVFPTVDPHLRGRHATGYIRADPDSPYHECTTITPSEAWTAGAIVATAGDVAAFLDGLLGGALLDPASLSLMTGCGERLDPYRCRGIGIVRFAFDGKQVAYGHTGGTPGFSAVALRTTTGRCVVLWQNGIDPTAVLDTDTPFIQAALEHP